MADANELALHVLDLAGPGDTIAGRLRARQAAALDAVDPDDLRRADAERLITRILTALAEYVEHAEAGAPQELVFDVSRVPLDVRAMVHDCLETPVFALRVTHAGADQWRIHWSDSTLPGE